MTRKSDDKTHRDPDQQVPDQMLEDAPELPDVDDAGEGKKNSANPVRDEERPDNTNTMGF